jgi:hypothetical protein
MCEDTILPEDKGRSVSICYNPEKEKYFRKAKTKGQYISIHTQKFFTRIINS